MAEAYNNIHQAVIDKCLAGDREAQSKLYQLYSKAMFNVCYRITNDYDEAEDVLQEAFVSAFKHLSSYQGTAAFGAWLKKIVVNKAINHMKRARLPTVYLSDKPMEEAIAPPSHDGREEPPLDVSSIKAAIQLLPDGYRLVFSLYLLEGYDHQEIAGILGISESTSKSQYNRSKKKLREILLNKGMHHGN